MDRKTDKMSESEKRIKSIRAHGNGAARCIRFKADIMISCSVEGEERILDLFLTQEQANLFHRELVTRLNQNLKEKK